MANGRVAAAAIGGIALVGVGIAVTRRAPEEEPPEEEAPAPTAGFSAEPGSGQAPLTVSFTNASRNADEFLWSFGDGSSSMERNPTHTYDQPGAHEVILRATGEGGEDTAALVIEVDEPPPPTSNPDFDVGDRVVTTNIAITLSTGCRVAQPVGTIENGRWDGRQWVYDVLVTGANTGGGGGVFECPAGETFAPEIYPIEEGWLELCSESDEPCE